MKRDKEDCCSFMPLFFSLALLLLFSALVIVYVIERPEDIMGRPDRRLQRKKWKEENRKLRDANPEYRKTQWQRMKDGSRVLVSQMHKSTRFYSWRRYRTLVAEGKL